MSAKCDALVKNGTWELVPPNSFSISLVASRCFALNVYLVALLVGIKLVLLQKVFINILT